MSKRSHICDSFPFSRASYSHFVPTSVRYANSAILILSNEWILIHPAAFHIKLSVIFHLIDVAKVQVIIDGNTKMKGVIVVNFELVVQNNCSGWVFSCKGAQCICYSCREFNDETKSCGESPVWREPQCKAFVCILSYYERVPQSL